MISQAGLQKVLFGVVWGPLLGSFQNKDIIPVMFRRISEHITIPHHPYPERVGHGHVVGGGWDIVIFGNSRGNYVLFEQLM